MDETAQIIECSNTNCLTPNQQDNKFCCRCGTPIVRRYLYALGDEINSYQQGEMINERYLVQQGQILLDTKPGLFPELTENLPHYIPPYLKLFPYRLHIPQPYGFITLAKGQLLWLLEYMATTSNQPLLEMPSLSEVWPGASAMKQLNWLWQMANLWQPMYDEEVAATLLEPSLIRVKDQLIKIKELQIKDKHKTSLKLLGDFWSTLVQSSAPTIRNLLKIIVQSLKNNKITDSQELLEILDWAITDLSKTKEYKYQICTYTDVGKTRQNNEDSCYPTHESYLEIDAKKNNPIAIVCDGIGGHEGGEIASQITIDFLQEELQKISFNEEQLAPEDIQEKLEKLIFTVNDLINERNNNEQRFQQRQRMGTTLVMSFIHNHEIYFSHVGDSRIYWITKSDCQQVTVDDDLGSRQVSLGYTLYRDGIQYPNAGALIQAIGMSPSAELLPTTKYYPIAEDSIFLLCSDGLSDYDRVEQYWEKEILPILTENRDISEVGKRLIEIANQTNGHDNITIALVYCQITAQENIKEESINFHSLIALLENLPVQEEHLLEVDDDDEPDTIIKINTQQKSARTQQFLTSEKKKKTTNYNLLLISLLITFGLGTLLYIFLVQPWFNKLLETNNSPMIAEGDIIKIKDNIILQPMPQNNNNNNYDGVGEVEAGSILQVIDFNNDNSFLQLKFCHSLSSNNLTALPQGESGWIATQEIINKIDPEYIPDSFAESWCQENNNLDTKDILSLTQGDIIKTTDMIQFQGDEIPQGTILEVIEILDDNNYISLKICNPLSEENTNINPTTPITVGVIPIQEIVNKIEKDTDNNLSLEGTSCNNTRDIQD